MILWEPHSSIATTKLNDMQLQFSKTPIAEGDSTTLTEGTVSLDVNGNLYEATSGKQVLLGAFKGADGSNGKDGVDGKDGATGANGKDGVDGKDGAGVQNVVLTKDASGALTGGTFTRTDGTTGKITVQNS